MSQKPIGVFDSGVGGLSVLAKCVKHMPCENYIYLADKAHMPYGALTPEEVRASALFCAETLVSMNVKAIAVACNTATELAIDDIRRLFPTIVTVGLEPAVKPCRRELGRGYAIALVTPATARSAKFLRLVSSCGDRILPVAQPRLAKLIEDNISDLSAIEGDIFCILSEYKDAEAVVLGCSHYAYITDIISRFYGGRIKIYDGADGEAARLEYCLKLAGMGTQSRGPGSVHFYSTVKNKSGALSTPQ